MCGRLTQLHTQAEIDEILEIERQYRIDEHDADPAPSWNVAPTQKMPVMGLREGTRVVRPMRWGLIPHWSKDAAIGAQCINARAETIASKPAFRGAFAKRRCVVAVSGWYEWRAPAVGSTERRKTPFYFSSADRRPLTLAGLWESWLDPTTGDELRTFSLVTCPPNGLVGAVHDRMPVLLDAPGMAAWLDPAGTRPALEQLLVPCRDERLEVWEVDRRVGNVRVNEPMLIEPVRATERAA